MSSGSIGDQRMGEVDKNENHWTIFLKGLGLRVGLETVRKVAMQVVSAAPLYPLYRSQERIPVAGKGTVYKIKGLIDDGKLDPLLRYWRLRETPEVDPIQLSHLRDLRKFLQEEPRIRDSFSVEPLGRRMESILKQPVSSRFSPWVPRSGFPGEAFPIISKIRSHCPEHQLWKDIDEWKRREDEYWQSISHIAVKLRAEFHEPLHSPGSEITSPTQEWHLLLDIFNWLAGQLLGNVPHFWFICTVRDEEQKSPEPTFRLAWGDTYYAQGTEEQIESARRAAEDILKRWSDSDDMRSLVRQYYSLEVLAQRIRDDIQHIDETALAQGTCPDCPILMSEQEAES